MRKKNNLFQVDLFFIEIFCTGMLDKFLETRKYQQKSEEKKERERKKKTGTFKALLE